MENKLTCNTCKNHEYSNIGSSSLKHHYCTIVHGKSGIHGGKIIPKNKLNKKPSWCPLIK